MEEVIELSVEETNKLRAQLGLKPLRISNNQQTHHSTTDPTSSSNTHQESNSEELSLSIDETNKLRKQLGLAPLKQKDQNDSHSGRKPSEAIHAPAVNRGHDDEIKERIEKQKLKRQVDEGLRKLINNSSKGENETSDNASNILDWAKSMRNSSGGNQNNNNHNDSSKADSNTNKSQPKKQKYTEKHLKGQNVTIAHSVSQFDSNSTTILTLADTNILDSGDNQNDDDANNNHDEIILENVNMTDNNKAKDNLKRKREYEMGLGHAGGYAGYDDDEFEELGGSQMTLSMNSNQKNEVNRKGFRLGDHLEAQYEDSKEKSDLFAGLSGKAISLESSNNHKDYQADFMTIDEEEGLNFKREEMEKRKKKKEKKLMKKLKKLNKAGDNGSSNNSGSNHDENIISKTTNESLKPSTTTLIEELEESAIPLRNQRISAMKKRRKRQRDDDSSDEDDEQRNTFTNVSDQNTNDKEKPVNKESDLDIQNLRKEKYQKIMEKGNNRTNNAFKEDGNIHKQTSTATTDQNIEKVEDDDAFLNAALSKARRINRLRELQAKALNDSSQDINKTLKPKGADAVMEAINAMKKENVTTLNNNNNEKSNRSGITFELDSTKEFTQALRLIPDTTAVAITNDTKIDGSTDESKPESIPMDIEHEPSKDTELVETGSHDDDEDDTDTLENLAHQVKEDVSDMGGFGSTASTAPMGRGLAGVLSILKHTGDMKNSGREELRGRSKDKRTYEDYEPLDLKSVVKIDTTGLSGNVHEKDLEFANREIKLDYRDEHGRLLTRKEAFRNLCYQFHGYGSSKKNEERRLKQVERERAEASSTRNSGSGGSGTLGALKATQQATGKAFVVHKT